VSRIITTKATIKCTHGGVVTPVPTDQKVVIDGGVVLCEGDLDQAPIFGCPQAGPGIKPCTSVASITPDSVSRKVNVGGRGVYLDALDGLTDGSPPGGVMVVDAGQTRAEA
jgi:hypothetical protein